MKIGTVEPIRRLHIHPLDLGGVGPDASETSDPERMVAVEREDEPTVRRLELGHRGQVGIDRRAHREPKAVASLQLVVAPRQILEPQPLDSSEIVG
jgi:hypothetical protein